MSEVCESERRPSTCRTTSVKEEALNAGALAEPLLVMDHAATAASSGEETAALEYSQADGEADPLNRSADARTPLADGGGGGGGAGTRLSLSHRLSFLQSNRPTRLTIDLPDSASPHFGAASSFDQTIASVKQAIAGGRQMELVAAGSSGSYWAFDASGAKVGIFKPKSEEPYGDANPKWGKWLHRVMCPCCFGRSCLLPNTGYLSEAAAYAMDVLLDLRVVPPTSIVSIASKSFNYNALDRRRAKLPEKIGSFQRLVQCNGDGRSVVYDNLKRKQQDALLDEFQRLVCLDYMTRNTDRGLDNWLTHVTADSAKVHAIDNGLAFPYKHPDNWRTYPPSWSSHALGRIPFKQEVRDHVLQRLSAHGWMAKTEKRLREIMFLDEIMNESLFQGQMAVIRGQQQNLIECLRKEGSTPEQLFNKHPLYILRKPTGMVGWKTSLPCFPCC